MEDSLRRLRLSWKTYELRRAHGVATPDAHANSHEMALKFGQLHHALHALAHQQLFNGAPPSPPAEWLSILSADPTPKSSVPLSSPPVNIPLSDPKAKHFMNAPVPPAAAVHVPGSEPAEPNHILEPLHAPNGHPLTHPPHHPLALDPHSYPFAHPFDLHAVPATVVPPANPPAALYKEPVQAKAEGEGEEGAEKPEKEGEDEGSFLQKAAGTLDAPHPHSPYPAALVLTFSPLTPFRSESGAEQRLRSVHRPVQWRYGAAHRCGRTPV